MDHELFSRLQYELKNLQTAKSQYVSQLSGIKNAHEEIISRTVDPSMETIDPLKMLLKRNVKKNGTYYSGKIRGDKKFKYIGTGQHNLVLQVKQAFHIRQTLDAISNDIDLIESVLRGYMPYDAASIDKTLPLTYQKNANGSLRKSADETRQSSHVGNVAPISPVISLEYLEAGITWKQKKLEYQAGFPENYPEHKTEMTSDGTMVKTISEMVIYERLLSAGLYFVYELPFPSNDYGPNLYPDFTILSPIDRKTELIIEYVGRLDQQDYRDAFARRIYRYMQNGYIPGVNLFLAFGDIRGHVDSLQVTKIIADILGTR